jgi:hypothetical protein
MCALCRQCQPYIPALLVCSGGLFAEKQYSTRIMEPANFVVELLTLADVRRVSIAKMYSERDTKSPDLTWSVQQAVVAPPSTRTTAGFAKDNAGADLQ